MRQRATSRRSTQPEGISRGQVIAVQGAVLGVRCSNGTFRAERAVSCLVEPGVGDRVLVHRAEDGDAYVLAVLARPEPGKVRLAIEGDAELRASGTLTLGSEKKVAVQAPAVEVRASDGALFIERLSYWGARAQALLGEVKLCASSLDSAVDRVSEHVKRAFRTVRDLDQLRAGRVDYRTEQDMSLRAENAIVRTRSLAKIDGKQIHIG